MVVKEAVCDFRETTAHCALNLEGRILTRKKESRIHRADKKQARRSEKLKSGLNGANILTLTENISVDTHEQKCEKLK